MRKIHVTRQFFEASAPQGNFFEKMEKKNIFRYALGEYVYQMSGLYSFSLGQGWDTNTHVDAQAYEHGIEVVINFWTR